MRTKTPLVLMELLMMVLVFAVSAAMCMKIFVRADQISREQELKTQAVFLAQNLAEEMKMERKTPAEFFEKEGWSREEGIWSWEGDPECRMTVCEVDSEVPGLIRVELLIHAGEVELFRIPVAWQEVTACE